MPLTKKGRKVKKTMEKTYGKKKGERVFYATENKGKIKGIARKRKKWYMRHGKHKMMSESMMEKKVKKKPKKVKK